MSLLLPELERQLRDVVRAHRTQRARLRRQRMPGLGVLAVAASTGVAVVLAVGAIVLLAHKQAPVAAHQPVSHRSSRQQLIDILAVLRRRQTTEDLSLFSIEQILLMELPSPSRIDRPLVRLATTTPWGARVFLVPYRPGLRFGLRHLRSTSETVAMMSPDGAEWSGVTARMIEAGDVYEGGWSSTGKQWSYKGIGIVPDGIAKVTVYVGKTLHAVVHNNVFAVRWVIRRSAGGDLARLRPVVRWYAPSGRQIKRVSREFPP